MTGAVWNTLRRSPALAVMAVLLSVSIAIQMSSALKWGHDSWQLTDWLINYAGGFVRRGLLGTAISGVSSFTGAAANLIVIATSLCLYLAVLYVFLKHTTHLFPPALILSCVVMGFPAYQDCIVRKDCLGLLLLIAARKLDGSDLPAALRLLGVNLLAGVAILCHEAFAFYGLPALGLFSGSHTVPLTWRTFLGRCVSLAPAVAVFGLVAKFHGSPQVAQSINDSWLPLWRSIEPAHPHLSEPAAAIEALGWTSERGLSLGLTLLTSGFYQPAAWAFVFAVSFALILWFAGRGQSDAMATRSKVRVATILCIQLLFISPLFVLGYDYGRWLFFWVVSSMMICASDSQVPGIFERPVRRAFERIPNFLPSIPAKDWVLLLFGVPVCWNFQSFILAAPLTRYLHAAVVGLLKFVPLAAG